MCSIESLSFLQMTKGKQLKTGMRFAFNLSFCSPFPGPCGLGDSMPLLPCHPHSYPPPPPKSESSIKAPSDQGRMSLVTLELQFWIFWPLQVYIKSSEFLQVVFCAQLYVKVLWVGFRLKPKPPSHQSVISSFLLFITWVFTQDVIFLRLRGFLLLNTHKCMQNVACLIHGSEDIWIDLNLSCK